MQIFVQMRIFFTSDTGTIDIKYLVSSNFCKKNSITDLNGIFSYINLNKLRISMNTNQNQQKSTYSNKKYAFVTTLVIDLIYQ